MYSALLLIPQRHSPHKCDKGSEQVFRQYRLIVERHCYNRNYLSNTIPPALLCQKLLVHLCPLLLFSIRVLGWEPAGATQGVGHDIQGWQYDDVFFLKIYISAVCKHTSRKQCPSLFIPLHVAHLGLHQLCDINIITSAHLLALNFPQDFLMCSHISSSWIIVEMQENIYRMQFAFIFAAHPEKSWERFLWLLCEYEYS